MLALCPFQNLVYLKAKYVADITERYRTRIFRIATLNLLVDAGFHTSLGRELLLRQICLSAHRFEQFTVNGFNQDSCHTGNIGYTTGRKQIKVIQIRSI